MAIIVQVQNPSRHPNHSPEVVKSSWGCQLWSSEPTPHPRPKSFRRRCPCRCYPSPSHRCRCGRGGICGTSGTGGRTQSSPGTRCRTSGRSWRTSDCASGHGIWRRYPPRRDRASPSPASSSPRASPSRPRLRLLESSTRYQFLQPDSYFQTRFSIGKKILLLFFFFRFFF